VRHSSLDDVHAFGQGRTAFRRGTPRTARGGHPVSSRTKPPATGARAADLFSAYVDRSSRGGNDEAIILKGELATLPGRTCELTGAESKRTRDIVAGFNGQGLTRNWAIPLLEHMDRQRLTRREEDRRRIPRLRD